MTSAGREHDVPRLRAAAAARRAEGGGRARGGGNACILRVQASVVSHPMQRYAVWVAGSVLASMPEFPAMCISRAQYEEHGPSVCRHNAVSRDGLG